MNFLPKCANCKLFADDLKAYITFSDAICCNDVDLLLNGLARWSEMWQLPVSVKKCNWMLISNRNISRELSLSLDRHNLRKVDEVKDLGILFHSKLSFSDHISNAIGKAK